MKNLISFITFIIIMGLIITSCDDDDYTGYSTLKPVDGVTLTVTPSFTSSVTMVEKDSTFEYTLELSEAQAVDVKVYAYVTDATATEGGDFTYTGNITIPAGSTSAKGIISILSDDLMEETETFTIQIGNQTVANVTYTPVSFDFTINNYTEDNLDVEMSWDTEVYDQYGDLIDPTDVADMILSIYNASDVLVAQADGGSFEHAVLSSTLADGSYYVVASFYAVEQYPDPVDIDITLDFTKLGVFTTTLSNNYVGLLQTNLCGVELQLAEIVKSGSSYTISENIVTEFGINNGTFVGNYGGEDGLSDYYAADVDIAVSGGDVTIVGLCDEWMVDWWGETITNQVPVVVTFNADGTLSIAEQYYITTDYAGDPYDYSIAGSGTYSLCDPISLHIEYDLNNTTDGYWVGELLEGYGYESYFTADLELGGKSKIEPGKSYSVKFDKSIIK